MAKKSEPANGVAKGVKNRKARFDYHIAEEHEAGLVLIGSEVKSILAGKANLTDGHCLARDGEMWLINVDVEPYDRAAAAYLPERRRDRKLLLHRRELDSLARKVREKGFTLIPLEMYFKAGKVKVRIGLGRGKAHHDKRRTIADRESKVEAARVRAGDREP